MAFSYVKYTGNGSTRVFNVPFSYLDRRHVTVKVDGIVSTFGWLSNSSIELSTVPADGVEVEIRRTTPNNAPLVDFSDGANITERDLDIIAYQTIYLSQENSDLAVELGAGALLQPDLVLTRSNEAVTAAFQAVSTANAAMVKATQAENTAVSVSGIIQTNKEAAAASAILAAQKAAEALSSASTAQSAVSTVNAAKDAAAASATAAAASAATAALAANFNPNDFYTKTQSDDLLNTRSFTQAQIVGLSASLAGKANTSHTHSISDVSGLQTALDAKLGVAATAAAALKLSTARSITLSGAVSGTASFDGSANITLATTSTSNIASQAEAEAGVDNTKMMTPLRTAQAVASLSGFYEEQIFTASGTWNAPAGVSENALVIIEGWGGGGGGGRDGSAPAGGGGGGGSYAQRQIRLGNLPTSVTVTVGAGGIGRASTSGNGTAGGNSTFGSFLTAYGGQGGTGGGSAATEGGGPGGGTDLWRGGAGGTGGGVAGGESVIFGGGGGGAGNTTATLGGTSDFGGAGGAGGDAAPLPTAGSAPGGGGGGGLAANAGNGARGEVRVRIFQ